MEFSYCPNCKKDTAHKKQWGIGTLLMVLLTGGLGILFMPFYPNRCIACGKDGESLFEWGSRVSGRSGEKSEVGVQGFWDSLVKEASKPNYEPKIKTDLKEVKP